MQSSTAKIKSYYQLGHEWGRLDSASGQLEKKEVIHLIKGEVTIGAHILDLGSGPGRYALALASLGYQLTLSDLSPRLIEIAKEKFAEAKLLDRVTEFKVANAVHLFGFNDNSFDAVFCNGPFYHLVNEEDRRKAASEVVRVCKPGGKVFIGFIPRFSGLAGLIDRAVRLPDQVSSQNFAKTAAEGVFTNNSSYGFQEGYYWRTSEIVSFWKEFGLKQVKLRSTRTFMHQNEDQMMAIHKSNPSLYQKIIECHRSFSADENFIAAGGHALLIGEKSK